MTRFRSCSLAAMLAALGAASDRFRPLGGLAALAGIARRQVGV